MVPTLNPADLVAREADELVLTFQDGVPVAIDGRPVSVLQAIEQLNARAGAQGVGRLDMVEDRLVGIKPHERSAEQQAVALVASSVLFHAREDKPVWQAHFERLRLPVGEWRSAEGVLLVEGGEVVQGWHKPPRARSARRVLRLDDYRAKGGVSGAVARIAETAFMQLSQRERNVARTVLLRLTDADERSPARRSVPLAELERINGAPRVLTALTDARLLTVGAGVVAKITE